MKIDIQLISLDCDEKLKSEHKIQGLKTRALLKNLRNKQEEIKQGNIVIFTHANKRYQKSINSKFNFFNKYAKHNFIKDGLAIYVKIGAFGDVKVKQVKIGEEKMTYLIIERKIIVFVLPQDGLSSSIVSQFKQAMEDSISKEQKKLGCKECSLDFQTLLVVSGDSFNSISKEYKQLSKDIQSDRPYKSFKQSDGIYGDIECEVLLNKTIGRIPIEIENPEKIKTLKEQFKIDSFKNYSEKGNKMMIWCGTSNGIQLTINC